MTKVADPYQDLAVRLRLASLAMERAADLFTEAAALVESDQPVALVLATTRRAIRQADQVLVILGKNPEEEPK